MQCNSTPSLFKQDFYLCDFYFDCKFDSQDVKPSVDGDVNAEIAPVDLLSGWRCQDPST